MINQGTMIPDPPLEEIWLYAPDDDCILTLVLCVCCVHESDSAGGRDDAADRPSVELLALPLPSQVPLVSATTPSHLRRPGLPPPPVQCHLLEDAGPPGSSASDREAGKPAWKDRDATGGQG